MAHYEKSSLERLIEAINATKLQPVVKSEMPGKVVDEKQGEQLSAPTKPAFEPIPLYDDLIKKRKS